MGLAASQARFLGITLRKANCEFKSTELAQQKLELTNQLSDISQDYANAMNSTKLVWQNDALDGDYGVTYSLLMMPSAANDYNPYLVSTKSGAIVLNSKYATAAKAAGISMSGGTPSQEGRDAFLASLAVSSDGKKNDNVITEHTFNVLTKHKLEDDHNGNGTVGEGLNISSYDDSDVSWHYAAGMGAVPKNKGVADAATLQDLINDPDIGQQKLDWLQIVKYETGIDGLTENEEKSTLAKYAADLQSAKLDYINAGDFTDEHGKSVTLQDVSKVVDAAASHYTEFSELENKIANESNSSEKAKLTQELENLKKGFDANGNPKNTSKNSSGKYLSQYTYPIYWAAYEQSKAKAKAQQDIKWSSNINDNSIGGTDHEIGINALLQADSNNSVLGGGTYTTNGKTRGQLSVVINDVLCHNAGELDDMTISDLLNSNVVLMTTSTGGDNSIQDISDAATAILEYVATVLGYNHIGTGLNVDETSDTALSQALEMTKRKMLKAGNAVAAGSEDDGKSMTSNAAYNAANKFNRICYNKNKRAAINLSNMVSAFLTYYDNYLRGTDSDYVVGKGIDSSDAQKSKTSFVTDDASYTYVLSPDDITNDTKEADFWNELYNNICAHGWRYDDMVQDSEYFESAVKDGRYSLMALNNDGYFYQQRYNDIGYMVEETDNDAIARAEAEYTQKKAELTYKEDNIDIKSKKLDAEIAELTTEISSVQNLISKSIEKTFSMFSN